MRQGDASLAGDPAEAEVDQQRQCRGHHQRDRPRELGRRFPRRVKLRHAICVGSDLAADARPKQDWTQGGIDGPGRQEAHDGRRHHRQQSPFRQQIALQVAVPQDPPLYGRTPDSRPQQRLSQDVDPVHIYPREHHGREPPQPLARRSPANAVSHDDGDGEHQQSECLGAHANSASNCDQEPQPAEHDPRRGNLLSQRQGEDHQRARGENARECRKRREPAQAKQARNDDLKQPMHIDPGRLGGNAP